MSDSVRKVERTKEGKKDNKERKRDGLRNIDRERERENGEKD